MNTAYFGALFNGIDDKSERFGDLLQEWVYTWGEDDVMSLIDYAIDSGIDIKHHLFNIINAVHGTNFHNQRFDLHIFMVEKFISLDDGEYQNFIIHSLMDRISDDVNDAAIRYLLRIKHEKAFELADDCKYINQAAFAYAFKALGIKTVQSTDYDTWYLYDDMPRYYSLIDVNSLISDNLELPPLYFAVEYDEKTEYGIFLCDWLAEKWSENSFRWHLGNVYSKFLPILRGVLLELEIDSSVVSDIISVAKNELAKLRKANQ